MTAVATAKVSDFIFDFLADAGVRHVFEVTGGGAMHLNDSVGRNARIEYICNLHEQASSFAAETYGKVAGDIGVCLVTAGPGGTNAVTGCAGAWLDSTPCFFLSGQVKTADLKGATGVRQMGVQEVDIVSIVASITKYAVTVSEADSIRFHLEKALHLARHGRPGPVWLDIPIDIQGAMVDPLTMKGYTPSADHSDVAPDRETAKALTAHVREVIKALNASERPLLFVGNGVRLAGAHAEFERTMQMMGIPVSTTWLTHDLIDDEHPLFVGRPGPVAPRGANFSLQNSDFLLSVGARLDMVVVGYAPKNFARAAYKVMVDIDGAELQKMKDAVSLAICADAKAFLAELLKQAGDITPRDRSAWLKRCKAWKAKYPVVLPEYLALPDRVSTYVLTDVLSDVMSKDDIVVSGSSGAGIEIFLLALRVKFGQRVLITTALGAMGYGLPAAVGACIAAGRRRTVLVDGDGGLQLNLQELETIRRLKLPVKLFILSNGGYASIRTSQMRYFGRLAGADATSGVTLPEYEAMAGVYSLPYVRIENQKDLAVKLRGVLEMPGPVICEVMVPLEEQRAPSLSSARRADGSMVSRPLEDLWPFLPREELAANMLIPLLPE